MPAPIPAAGIVGARALREAATTELNQMMNLVRAALQARYDLAKKPGESYVWFDIEAMYADRVIVCKDGRYWSFAYKLDDKNNVQLEEPKEVIEQFTPVREARPAGESVLLVDPDATGIVRMLEAADLAKRGKSWDVVIVRAGRSKNNVFYPDAVLRESVSLFEGARVYVKSDDEHLKADKKDARQLFGWLSGVRFVEGKSTDTGHLAGVLNVGEQFKELRETIVDAWDRGKRDLVGLSINAYGKTKKLREGVRAESIAKVSSVDLIVDPAAGGSLVRMVEAADPDSKEQNAMFREAMVAKIKAKFPQVDTDKLTDQEVMAKYSEAIAAEAPAPRQDVPAGGFMTREEFQAAQRLVEARQAARDKITRCGLPDAAVAKLLDWANRQDTEHLAEAAVDATIKAEREYLARFTESGHVSLGGLDDVTVEDRPKRIADMLDAFFDPKHKNHRVMHSFKECYIEITGDRRVTGQLEHMDRRRLRESVGAMRESLDTTALADVLGSALRRRLLADYRENTAWDCWRLACQVVPVADFRTNERTRLGGYGNLAAVNEGGAYAAMSSPSDEKADYAVTKRGGTEDLTIEAIKNDDVGAIRRIPVAMSRAAKRTLCEFVLDFVRTNPTIYDSVAFFHASHGNLGSAALDATSLAARRLAMKKQTELSSSKRLGIGPRNIWVPDDLEETAVNLFARNTNNDATFVNKLSLTVVPVPYWTDANDWALSADKDDLPGIEIGFLDGNEEPEIFVQDMPNVGSMFSNDKLTWKIRHIYGGDVVDFRGWDKSVVA